MQCTMYYMLYAIFGPAEVTALQADAQGALEALKKDPQALNQKDTSYRTQHKNNTQ